MNRHTIGAALGLSAMLLLALPAAALGSAPGPPNVEVIPPEAVVEGRDGTGVTFDPGLIRFTYPDGATTSCVLDPALPPNPCSELATAPGPPNVEVVPPEAILGEDGGLLGFVPGVVRITYADGTRLECVLDPLVPPSPCVDATR